MGTVVRAQTLMVLEGSDHDRKRSNLLKFLYKSGLMHKDKPVVSLVAANLSRINLSERDNLRASRRSLARREMP